MHTLSTAFVLGYHGCDAAVAERVLHGEALKPSTNDYDWLGNGVYFWEANPRRGLEFAQELASRPKGSSQVTTPAVVGAIIDLGLCLDLTTSAGLDQVRSAYEFALELASSTTSGRLPENHSDRLRKRLDCAVVNTARAINERLGIHIDTVKGAFIEGTPIYPDATFFSKTHIQICVCNPRCIKGVFRVPAGNLV